MIVCDAKRGALRRKVRRRMEMEVQGRKRGKRKRRWFDRVKGSRENGLSGEIHGGVYRRTSTPHKRGTKMKREKKYHLLEESCDGLATTVRPDHRTSLSIQLWRHDQLKFPSFRLTAVMYPVVLHAETTTDIWNISFMAPRIKLLVTLNFAASLPKRTSDVSIYFYRS